MSDKQESYVFITDPDRFADAIKTFQNELGEIELQRWYGDQITPATKADFTELRARIDALQGEIENYVHRVLMLADQTYTLVRKLHDDLNADKEEDPKTVTAPSPTFILNCSSVAGEAEAIAEQIAKVFAVPPAYLNADREDGVDPRCYGSLCSCSSWTDPVDNDVEACCAEDGCKVGQ